MPTSLRHLRFPPRSGGLQRFLQLLQCRTREDRSLVTQQVIGVNLVARQQLHAFQIARAQMQVVVLARRVLDQQRRAFGIQLVQRFAEVLGLGSLEIEVLYHYQLAVRQLRRQRGAQRAQQLLARELIVVRAGLRSVNRTAVTPQRRADRTYASAARTLLSPELLAGAAHQLLVLGGVRTGTLPGPVMPHRFPEQVLVHCTENFIG